MTTTVGQLVASLFDRYKRVYHDRHLAALVTQLHVNDVLQRGARTPTRSIRLSA
jgi:hypothetical protein